MKHLVIGAGNLGIDIYQSLVKHGHQATLCSRSNGFELIYYSLKNFSEFVSMASSFDVVWYCLGYGSVSEAKTNSEKAYDIHVNIPARLLDASRYFIYFSSDYVADESAPLNPNRYSDPQRSHYAHLKLQMESKILYTAENKTTAIRVGSLYGKHKPLSSFPGRLIQNALKNKSIKLPINLVTPTSTEWLSNLLVENFDAFYKIERIIHASPSYFTSVLNWGSLILDEQIYCNPFFDYERPLLSCLGTSFISQQTDWRDIWQKEWKPLKEKIYQCIQVDSACSIHDRNVSAKFESPSSKRDPE